MRDGCIWLAKFCAKRGGGRLGLVQRGSVCFLGCVSVRRTMWLGWVDEIDCFNGGWNRLLGGNAIDYRADGYRLLGSADKSGGLDGWEGGGG